MNRGRGGSRRPNRGGGRFNAKPRALNPAFLSSAKLERDQDQEDYTDDYDEEFVYADAIAGTREPAPDRQDRKSAVPAKSKWRSKAPIQRLQMDGENQEMIEEVLRDLQLARSSIEDRKSGDFDDKQVERNEAYWKKAGDQKLVVESGINFAADRENELKIEVDEEIYSSYAVDKLLHCGFEKKRCIDALKQNDGDLGAALEYLLCGCCDLSQLGKKNPAYSEETFQEATVQRQEEAMALESIYNEAFTEVLADSVWTIKLELPFLQAEFEPKNTGKKLRRQKTASKSTEKAADVCRFFQKGYCKFGDKCRLTHGKSDNETSSNGTNSEPEVKDITNERTGPSFLFHLEVRFCKGSLYPFEPPLVVFYSSHESVSPSGCLNVTLRLNRESKDLSDTQSPVIFCLTSLLENEEEILACFKMPPSEYSLPVTAKIVTAFNLTNSQHTAFERDQPSDKSRAVNKMVGITEPRASPDVLQTQQKNRKLKQEFYQLQVNI